MVYTTVEAYGTRLNFDGTNFYPIKSEKELSEIQQDDPPIVQWLKRNFSPK